MLKDDSANEYGIDTGLAKVDEKSKFSSDLSSNKQGLFKSSAVSKQNRRIMNVQEFRFRTLERISKRGIESRWEKMPDLGKKKRMRAN